ncbi:hydroxyacylglutathione hydrolase [Amaricoccus macauensis]|uniref:hydroxyacylglutathione hydrolase n=1 Tax=Amaricoccus macauensis TaxID=57001 RepID=UPI003C7DF752
MSLEVVTIPCLSDNYAYILRDNATGKVALVDAPEAGPIARALGERTWSLDLILITHHHNDHIAGVDELKEKFGARVAGATADAHRLPKLDMALSEGDSIDLGESRAIVLDVPGHTVGHIAFFFPVAKALFSADSLMALGCGRLFEGTPDQMWESLCKMAALPGDTKVYSGHEYSLSNAKFALSVDPENPALKARCEDIKLKRSKGSPTVPVFLSIEQETNPFIRAADPALKAELGLSQQTDAQVFAEIRKRKDSF